MRLDRASHRAPSCKLAVAFLKLDTRQCGGCDWSNSEARGLRLGGFRSAGYPNFRCSAGNPGATVDNEGATTVRDGKLIMTRVPRPTLLVTDNLPPISSAIRRATVRPIPSPEYDRCIELSP